MRAFGKITAVSAALLVFAAGLCAQEEKSVTLSRCIDLKGNMRWESTTTIVPIAGKPAHYLLTEEGSGTYSDFKGKTSNKSEFEFISDKDRLAPLHLKRQVFSEDGKLIFEEIEEFDNDKSQVACDVKDYIKNTDGKKTFQYKGDIVNKFLMGLYIRRVIASGETERTVYLVNDEPALYRIKLIVMGKEEITVNGKKREAYKIGIDPQIGLLSPVKAFIPKNYDWHSAEPPYEWLMFRGLESSIDSPKVEIISLDNNK